MAGTFFCTRIVKISWKFRDLVFQVIITRIKLLSQLAKHSKSSTFWPIPGSFLSGISVYLVLSYLLIPMKIVVPESIITSLLVFGLSSYYNKTSGRIFENKISTRKTGFLSISTLSFILVYAIFIVISLSSVQNLVEVYTSWTHLDFIKIIGLTSAIGLSFYLPGYAIISIIDRKNELGRLPKSLLGYIFSLLVTGLPSLLAGSVGVPVEKIEPALNMLYIIILISFTLLNLRRKGDCQLKPYTMLRLFWAKIKQNYPEFLILVSLLSFVILSTAYLYNGALVSDQLFHHGRSLLFLSGAYSDLAAQDIEAIYLPYMHAFLAGFFSLADVPSVNAFVSISFLNFVPVLAFYYFCSRWFCHNKRASLLAASLFMLSSGFGWAYLIGTAISAPPYSPDSAFRIIENAGLRTFDIRQLNNFLNAGTFTIPLLIFGLPCGFVLLGLVKEDLNDRLKYFVLVTGVTALGVLSHEEFGLFVIVSCLAPILFGLPKKSYLYLSIAFAIFSVLLTSYLSPSSEVYHSREIFGIPFNILLSAFVFIAWSLYLMNIQNKLQFSNKVLITLQKILKGKIKLFLVILLIGILCYVYLFMFVTWSQIPLSDLRYQVTSLGARIVPWYLYGIRFGIVGIMGLIFLISYIFKKFEKEVFIFFVLSVVALFAGPYYNEYRTHKYIIASMAALASLLLYNIIIHLKNRPIMNGIVISSIILTSGLSVLIYQGYMAIAIEHPSMSTIMTHRYIPQNIDLFNFLHTNIDLRVDNIAIPNDYIHHFRRHQPGAFFAEEIEGFVGIPFENKLTQAASVLQSSNLEGFYNLLIYSNTKYIVLPKEFVRNGLSEINSFALQNFPKVFEDSNDVVLLVPSLTPPSANSDLALVLEKRLLDESAQVVNLTESVVLNYTAGNAFSIDPTNRLIHVAKEENMARLLAAEEPVLLSSNDISGKVNFIESKFRIISENKNTANHAGIFWNVGKKTYYVFVREHSISFYNPVTKQVITDNAFIREKGVWYTIKIIYDKKDINILVNDIPRFKVPISPTENQSISNVGIRSFFNVADYAPIKIGFTSVESSPHFDAKDKEFKYYYPLNIIALPRIEYNSYLEGDLAIFSKKNIILSHDPTDIEVYTRYIKSGGTLIVLNTDDNFEGGFSKFFDLIPTGSNREFSRIEDNASNSVNILGNATDIRIGESSNHTVLSYYTNSKGQSIPFAVEKKLERGRVIFVNAQDYFNAISMSPDNYFMTLGKISALIGLDATRIEKDHHISVIPPIRFVGDFSASGRIMITSSSIYFPTNGFDFDTENISTRNKNGIISLPNSELQNRTLKVTNLEVLGPFQIFINSSKLKYVPALSEISYIPLSFPVGLNMMIKLGEGSKAHFSLTDDSNKNNNNNNDNKSRFKNSYTVTEGEIFFNGIKNGLSNEYPSVFLMKNPKVSIEGNMTINELYARNPNDTQTWLANGDTLQVKGKFAGVFDNVEKYSSNAFDTRRVSYISGLRIDGITETSGLGEIGFALPGDISPYAKEKNIQIPVQEAFSSKTNRDVLVIISIVSVTVVYLIWRRISKIEFLKKSSI